MLPPVSRFAFACLMHGAATTCQLRQSLTFLAHTLRRKEGASLLRTPFNEQCSATLRSKMEVLVSDWTVRNELNWHYFLY